jgi:hypothetical protein
MMKLSIHYPWEQTEKGQGFFIPCLDTDAVREAGLKESVKLRILDARATVGIRNGLMGVWFYRAPRASHPQS